MNHMRVTQSLQGIAVPIVFGTTRVPGKLIWYGDFKSQRQATPGGKAKGSKSGALYTYTASWIALLCEGPVLGINSLWDQSGQFVTNPAQVTYTILGAPAAPSLSSVAGGPATGATYYVTSTYVDANGESGHSTESSIAIANGNAVQVASPAAGYDATGWNVYVSTATGTETKQNSTPIAIGASWTLPSSGLVTGGAAHPPQPIVTPPPPPQHPTWPGPINVDNGVTIGTATGKRIFFN